VVGAAIESDAHTVGIDAILNMKGFAGNYGLERHPQMDVLNMGSQVPCEQLLSSNATPTRSSSRRSSPRRTSTSTTSRS